MKRPEMTREDLLALLAERAAAPITEATQFLVRHVKCKESLQLARSVAEASRLFREESNSQQLSPPSELLPPLG